MITDLQITTPQRLGLLFGLTALASSATSVVAPDIAADLDLETSGVAAIFVAFSLAFAATTAIYGRLGDLHGQRRPMTAGLILLAVGSIGSALAPNLTLLLLGRVVQGAGAGAVPALVPGIITTQIDEARQPAALSVVAAVAGVFAAIGPFLGGLSGAIINWRLAVALPAAGVLLIPTIGSIAAKTGDNSKRLDNRGAVLTAVAATGLVLLLQAPGLGRSVGFAGAAMLLSAGPLLARHYSATPDGFIPRTIAAHGSFWVDAFVGAGLAAVYLSILLSVPVRLATNESWSALQIGAALATAAIAGPLASIASKQLSRRVSPAALAGAGVAAAGFGAVVAALVGSPIAQVFGLASVLIGFGLAQPALIDRVARSTAPDLRGIAIGLFNLVFFLGGAVGSAVIGSLGIRNGSLATAAFAIAAGLFLARPHHAAYKPCVRSTGTIAGAIHCLTASPPPTSLLGQGEIQ